MDLAAMRTQVRRDLRDTDAGEERWSDDDLNRHIQRALQELSLAAPREATATLQTTAGSRDVSVLTLTDRVTIDAVEFPTGKYPPSFIAFSLWADTLTMLIDDEPSGSQDVVVYYSRSHVLDDSGTTLAPPLEDLVATGAGAYAALEWASFATNRVNVGGAETWRHYHIWAQDRLAAFARALAKHGRERRMRSRRLYVPADGALGDRPLGE